MGLPVSISNSGGRLTGAFNVSEFEKLQQLVPQNMIDCVQLNGLAFDHDWTRYLAIREENSGYNGESVGVIQGLSKLLSQPFGHNIFNMLQNNTLDAESRKIRAWFASEL